MYDLKQKSLKALKEIAHNMKNDNLPIWIKNRVERNYKRYVNYLYNKHGQAMNTDKYLIAQARLIWRLCTLSSIYRYKDKLVNKEKQEVGLLNKHFRHNTNKEIYNLKFKRNSSFIKNNGMIYLDKSYKIWKFDKKYFIDKDIGNWGVLLKRKGDFTVSFPKKPWKAIHDT